MALLKYWKYVNRNPVVPHDVLSILNGCKLTWWVCDPCISFFNLVIQNSSLGTYCGITLWCMLQNLTYHMSACFVNELTSPYTFSICMKVKGSCIMPTVTTTSTLRWIYTKELVIETSSRFEFAAAHVPGMPGMFPPAIAAIPTCITTRASRTCCDACRDR